MSWKYIMVKVDDRHIPILFPSELVHQDVYKRLGYLFHEAAKLGDPRVVSAGFVEGLIICATVGESETLDLKSRPEDVRLINNHPYEQGRDTGAGALTEALVLSRTADMVLDRAKNIVAEAKAGGPPGVGKG